eukprot:6103626-Alexandrium_andersonii.AAC.1
MSSVSAVLPVSVDWQSMDLWMSGSEGGMSPSPCEIPGYGVCSDRNSDESFASGSGWPSGSSSDDDPGTRSIWNCLDLRKAA